MLSAGYFRIRSALPGPVWMYPVSYIAFHTFSIQVSCNTFYIIWWQLIKKSRVYLPYFFSLQLNLDTLYFIRLKMSVPLKEQTGPNSHFPFSMELLITFACYHVSTYSPMTTWSSGITYSSCSSLVGEKKLYILLKISPEFKPYLCRLINNKGWGLVYVLSNLLKKCLYLLLQMLKGI